MKQRANTPVVSSKSRVCHRTNWIRPLLIQVFYRVPFARRIQQKMILQKKLLARRARSRKARNMTSHVRCWEGTTRSTSGIAANSSRMMDDGSFCPPSCREAIVQIGIPIQHTASQNAHSMKRGNWANESAVIIGNAAADPHVPGAGRALPIQKTVASSTAG